MEARQDVRIQEQELKSWPRWRLSSSTGTGWEGIDIKAEKRVMVRSFKQASKRR
ncbi:hypothetical protein LM599_00160 [Candidatus Acetothermia bacterium]|nr:hypothetical protein [Candidatus Acetothermia bacterium]